jgi:DHA1 family bicyclomycin/chloramphenicol resistance-like MFS transporter
MASTFISIFRNPQFATYTLAGAFAFSGLFIFVAGSPVIFMGLYNVSPEMYGGIFALLAAGYIGGSQLNILLIKHYSSQRLFKTFLALQMLFVAVFLMLDVLGWVTFYSCAVMFFLVLSSIGILSPNAGTLASAPFQRNIGSAFALMSFMQIGIPALASAAIAWAKTESTRPSVVMLFLTTLIAFVILLAAQKGLKPVAVEDASGGLPPVH